MVGRPPFTRRWNGLTGFRAGRMASSFWNSNFRAASPPFRFRRDLNDHPRRRSRPIAIRQAANLEDGPEEVKICFVMQDMFVTRRHHLSSGSVGLEHHVRLPGCKINAAVRSVCWLLRCAFQLTGFHTPDPMRDPTAGQFG